jgi:hypothetical protein
MDRESARKRLDALVRRYQESVATTGRDPALTARVRALAKYQSQRLAATYADLRRQPRYGPAVEFFLADLYGPQDMRQRDLQVLRALDKLKRFLPAAFEVHVLTIELDAATAARLRSPGLVDDAAYAAAYRAAGRRQDRDRQITLIGEIGALLDSLAHRPEVGLAIRLARGPAHAAGYGQLQDFLERGYDAFRKLDGAGEFLTAIDERERELMHRLLD